MGLLGLGAVPPYSDGVVGRPVGRPVGRLPVLMPGERAQPESE